MTYQYRTKGTCSRVIDFEINDGIVSGVKFHGGCDGNLKCTSSTPMTYICIQAKEGSLGPVTADDALITDRHSLL